MDVLIQKFPAVPDADLMLCEENGVAYQRDMQAGRVPYDADYLAKCLAYEGSPIAQKVNAGRCALLMRHLPVGAAVLDIGAGTGAFVRAAASWGFAAKGFDLIPETVDRLRAAGSYADDVGVFEAVAMWDSIEHMENPADVLGQISKGAMLFVSVPVFTDLRRIRDSKHYRPGEHLLYFTAQGFIDWMAAHGFRLLEQSEHETKAGRDSIGAFAFVRESFPFAHCECGGETRSEHFDHPRLTAKWFLRCTVCGLMSDFAHTESDLQNAQIKADPCAPPT